LACRRISNIKLYRWDFDPARDEAEVRRLADRVRVLGQDDAHALALAAFALVWVCREYDLAWSFVERAVSVNPNLAGAWLMRGGVAEFLGDHETAIESLETGARISPVGFDFHIAQGYVALASLFLGNYSRAIASATAAEALIGNPSVAAKSLAQLRALNPDLRVSSIEEAYPYRRAEDMARLREGLRLAGLPE
jgi:tetratricopeptide (TPR) repeat protein